MASKKGFGYSFSLDNSDFKKKCKEIQQTLDKTFGKKIMALSGGAVKALAGISAALAGIGAAAMAMGEKLDSALTGLQGLWGSAQKATEQYERLKTIAENSMFGIDTLTAVDKKISALGVSAEESATIISRLGNAVVGTNGNAGTLEAMAEALVKIKTTGQVSTRNLMEFAKAGIKVDDLIGGSATNAVNKLIDRMQKYNGIMKGESTDIWIQYKRVVKIAEDALAKLGNYINDNFKGYVVSLVDKLSELRDSFVKFLNDKNGMASFIENVKILGGVITAVAVPALARFAVGFLPAIASTASLIATITALSLAIKDMTDENSLIINGWKKIELYLKLVLSEIRENFGDTFDSIATSAYNTFVQIANFAIKGANLAINAITKLANIFLKKFKSEIADLLDSMAVGASYLGLEEQAQKLQATAREISKGMQFKVEPIKLVKEKDFGEIKSALDSLIGESSEEILNEIDEVDKKVETGVKTWTDRFEGLKDTVKNIFDFKNVGSSLNSALNSLETGNIGTITANGNSGNVGNGTTSDTLWAKLKDSFLDYYTVFISKAKEIYDVYVKYQEKIKAMKEAYQQWEDGIKRTLNEGLHSAFREALASSDNFFNTLGESLRKLGKQILAQIGQMVILTSLFRMAGISSGSFGIHTVSSWKNRTINDGIVQNGRIITTHPDDYIIATKDPSSLGGKANVVVNVNNNSSSEVSTNSYFDGTRTIVDIVIDGLQRNVNGLRDTVRAI